MKKAVQDGVVSEKDSAFTTVLAREYRCSRRMTTGRRGDKAKKRMNAFLPPPKGGQETTAPPSNDNSRSSDKRELLRAVPPPKPHLETLLMREQKTIEASGTAAGGHDGGRKYSGAWKWSKYEEPKI